jgi:chemotaxis signal transduction protein
MSSLREVGMREHYAVLNLPEGATLTDVKKASRKLLLKYHPDLHPGNQGWAQEKTKKILTAYNVLYDMLLSPEISFRLKEDFVRTPVRPRIVPLMCFSVSNINLAIPVQNVRHISRLKAIKVTSITTQKEIYPYIVGIINYQDEVAPLLDLGQKLHIQSVIDNKQALICELDGHPVGLVIDSGKGIVDVLRETLDEEFNLEESDIDHRYLINILNLNGEKVHILDLERIISN